MARRPEPGKCVHCLHGPVERNWDHVFPQSWYPDSTPPNLYKWQIPSCVRCNSELGKLEEEFLVLIAPCLDPNSPASQSIVEKARRARDPHAATNPVDRRARASLQRHLVSRLVTGSQIPEASIYPTLGAISEQPIEKRIAIFITTESFRRVTDKIVRGIFFLERQIFIEPPYTIQFYPDGPGAQLARQALDQFGMIYAREPGVVVRQGIAIEDGISSVFEIEFWGQLKTYATVTNDEF